MESAFGEPTLAYRCGGSTGVSPVSRLTRAGCIPARAPATVEWSRTSLTDSMRTPLPRPFYQPAVSKRRDVDVIAGWAAVLRDAVAANIVWRRLRTNDIQKLSLPVDLAGFLLL